MSQSRSEVSIETLRFLADRAGLTLTDQELADIGNFYNPAQMRRLLELDLKDYEPAPIYFPDWRG